MEATVNQCGAKDIQPIRMTCGPAYFALCKARRLCYTLPHANLRFRLFLGSSAVEHSTVNRMVAGSNPARGAKKSLSPSTFLKLMVPCHAEIICRVPSPPATLGAASFGTMNSNALTMALRVHTTPWHPAPIHSVLLQARSDGAVFHKRDVEEASAHESQWSERLLDLPIWPVAELDQSEESKSSGDGCVRLTDHPWRCRTRSVRRYPS